MSSRQRRATPNANNQDGQSLVEVALMLPVLILILAGVVDLGRVYYTYVTITNAAREGARAGASNPTDNATIKSRTEDEAANSRMTISDSNITIDCAPYGSSSFSSGFCASADPGDQVRISVTVQFNLVTGYIFGLTALTLSNNAVMSISL